MKDEQVQLRIHYNFDAFLMHLIQDVTKRTSADILNFFHELGHQVCDVGMQKRTGNGIDKRIDDYFPGTAIPFHMRAKGRKSWQRTWNPQTRSYDNDGRDMFCCSVEVGFPEHRTPMSEELLKDISTQLMEKALGFGGEVNVAPFERPAVRTPKVLKEVIDAFAGRPAPEKKPRKRKSKVDEEAPA